MVLQDPHQLPDMSYVVCGGVLEPRYSFARLSVERGFRCGETRGLFQVLVEPLASPIVQFLFVRVKLPFLSQSQNSMEHT
jgi:hypothetical protein